MLPVPRRAAGAVFAAVTLLAASTVTITTAQCVAFDASATAGDPEDVSIAAPYHYACPDDKFLMSVNVTYEDTDRLKWLQWSCLSYDDWTVQFTVGITGVETLIVDGIFPRLGYMYFGGENLGYYSDTDGMSSTWKGPYGDFSVLDDVLPDYSGSYCGTDAFATGMTIWASSSYLYGVKLECAAVTGTCYPDDYPASLIEDYDGSSATSSDDDWEYVSPTDESSAVSTSLVIAICASVGGGLCLVGTIIGVAVCCICRHRRRESEKHHHQMQTAAAATAAAAAVAPAEVAVITVAGEQGDSSVYNNGEAGAASCAAEDLPPPRPPPSAPPLPHGEPPKYSQYSQ